MIGPITTPKAWEIQETNLRLASLVKQANSRDYSLYTYGIDLAKKNNVLIVKNVLRGSIAERTGLRVGELIVTVNRRKVTEILPGHLSELLSPSNRENVTIGIKFGGQLKEISLTSEPYSSVLRHIRAGSRDEFARLTINRE